MWYRFFREFLTSPPSAKISARYVPGHPLGVPRILKLIIVTSTCGCDTYWPRCTTQCRGLVPFYVPSNVPVSQAFKGVISDLESAIELLESIESFLNRLDIYTKVPPTPTMTEIIVKIMVVLLSTLALATDQIRQGRPSEFVFANILPASTQCREICKEAFRRKSC